MGGLDSMNSSHLLDVSIYEHPQLTNIHPSDRTIELFFFPGSLLNDPFFDYPSIMKALGGTCNRNPKYFPLVFPSQGCHNKSMKNKKYNVDEEIERFEDFIAWAKENFEELSKKNQCRLENFSYDVQDMVSF